MHFKVLQSIFGQEVLEVCHPMILTYGTREIIAHQVNFVAKRLILPDGFASLNFVPSQLANSLACL